MLRAIATWDRRRWLSALTAVFTTFVSLPLLAQTAQSVYPEKPIRLVVAFPPGGTTDVLARLLAHRLSEKLGQSIVIDNRSGASGVIGTDAVVKSSADGYTLLFASSPIATYTSLYSKAGLDPVRDLEPIALVASTPYVLVVHPSLPVRSVAELVAYAKAKPGEINYAASGPGTGQHLGWELLKRSTGTDMVYVPYKGTGSLLQDLLSGRLQAGIDNVAILTQYIKSGSLRGIATTGSTRSPVLPDLPTIAESGVTGFRVIGWFGFFAPVKTPAPIIKRLNDAIVEVMREKPVRDRMLELGAEPEVGSQDALRKLLPAETALWGKLIREIGIKVE
jgi:tripartite-type tricarboxylate transporter receptor subunit TctC